MNAFSRRYKSNDNLNKRKNARKENKLVGIKKLQQNLM